MNVNTKQCEIHKSEQSTWFEVSFNFVVQTVENVMHLGLIIMASLI